MTNKKRREAAAQAAAGRQKTRKIVVGGVVLLVTFAAFSYALRKAPPPPNDQRSEDPGTTASPSDVNPITIPDLAPTRFRNVAHSVGYVGAEACRECHAEQYGSFLHTTHSQSLSEVNVANEPPDGEFFHKLSGRHYRVYRDGETLRLQEFIEDDAGAEIVLADHAARYALGSGHYARMYLSEVDNYLIESPMTWYPRRKEWGMSAGYELDPCQPGFSRSIGWGCMNCHAARVDTLASDLQLEVKELTISCERCHGPGELHIAERKAELPITGGVDETIVNLRHLSRERKEDVCSQCHLSSAADVLVRGRRMADFRPGQRMADFRISHRVDRPESARTVSGQIEQMRSSKCYVESETMTCATCHNPHAHADESRKIERYRQQCLNCHQRNACGEQIERRNATQPKDYCVSCHMPKGPTDIPHFSFTHHRIGIHPAGDQKLRYTSSDKLVPVVDTSHLPELERQRLLGLADDAFAAKLAGGLDDETRDDPAYFALADVFAERARAALEDARDRGLRDSNIELLLSRRAWRVDPDRCIQHAKLALDSPPVSSATRRDALFKLASSYIDTGRYAQAMPILEQLVGLERNEIAYMLLALCHQKKGNLPEAVRLIENAIATDPSRADFHSTLASLLQRLGNPREAEFHMQRAAILAKLVPQPE